MNWYHDLPFPTENCEGPPLVITKSVRFASVVVAAAATVSCAGKTPPSEQRTTEPTPTTREAPKEVVLVVGTVVSTDLPGCLLLDTAVRLHDCEFTSGRAVWWSSRISDAGREVVVEAVAYDQVTPSVTVVAVWGRIRPR